MPTPRGVTPPLPSNPYEVRERMDSSARRCWWRCEGCPRPSKGMPLLLSQKTWRSSSCRPVGRFVQSVVEMRSRRTCYFSWEFALSTKKIQRIVLFVFQRVCCGDQEILQRYLSKVRYFFMSLQFPRIIFSSVPILAKHNIIKSFPSSSSPGVFEGAGRDRTTEKRGR